MDHSSDEQAPEQAPERTDERPSELGTAHRTPMEREPAITTTPPGSAAGLGAVASTMRFGLKEMGVRRSVSMLLKVNQKDGFDCQSCAWPNPDGHRHIAEFCENGAKAVASESTRRRASRELFARYSVAELSEQSDQWLNDQGRLTEPMVLRPGATHYEPIRWSEAFALIADELHDLDSPDEATFYTSGRTSNEAAFLYQLFVRSFGTNNLPDCSNMCHESSGAAMTRSIGVGKSTVVFEDFDRTDLIVVIGQNPGTNHPRMLSALERAKRNGARIISINPMPEAGLVAFRNPNPQDAESPLGYLPELLGRGTTLTDLFLQVGVNGDVALLKGIMKAILEIEDEGPGSAIDRAFIDEHTHGFDEFLADLRDADWAEIERSGGVALDRVRAAAEMIAGSERMIVCWAMGLTQHRNGVDNVAAVMNLLLLGGHMGRPGAGACCVRGHSNVQGDRTMGIWERPRSEFLDALGSEFDFEPPREDGLDSVDSIRAMGEGAVKVFIAMGGNLLSAAPDTDATAAAMRRCRLTAQISTKLHRGHLVTGRTALILPCLGRSERDVQRSGEQFVTVEDSLSVISSSRGSSEPASPDLLSEPAIVAGIATATLPEGSSTVDWDGLVADYGRIRDHISRVVPGFDDFNERIAADVFTLPNAAAAREFRTGTGRANFAVTPIPEHDLDEGTFLLTTIRSHDQFNTTVYGPDDRYRGISGGRRVIFMNRSDMARSGLEPGQMVDVTSHFRGTTRTAPVVQVVAHDIARGSTAMYFPEANVLVPLDSVAEVSNTPTSKSVRVTITPTITPTVSTAP